MRRMAVTVAATLLCATAAQAQSKIFSCVDAAGNKHTSDRLIKECRNGEQVEQNADGSPRRIVPRPLTDEERAAADARELERNAVRADERARLRHEGILLRRYPDQAVHDRARQAALYPARAAMRASERRGNDLAADRKRLAAEEEFYPGRPLPARLRAAIDANEAAHAAQLQAIEAHRAELARVNAGFDAELALLQRLWGTPPGRIASRR